MKVPVISSLILLGGLSSLPAIERPKSLDDINSKVDVRATSKQGKDGAQAQGQAQENLKEQGADQRNEPEAIPHVDQPPGAWLGVFSEPVDDTLRTHLGVDKGVVLDYVAPDSPAAEAGLKQHDIILKVDGVVIGSQEELREAIQGHKPEDKVTLTVLSKGEKGEREVALGERPQAVPAIPQRGGAGAEEGGPGLQFRNLRNLPNLNDLQDLNDLIPREAEMQKQLEGHMKRLEKQLREMERRGGGGLKLDFDLFKDLHQQPNNKGGGFNFNFKATSSFKFVDENGSVEMKSTNGGKEVIVKNTDGKLLFEGPWDTDQDKAAAPEDIRERVEGMNNGNEFRFNLENLPEPDVEIPKENVPDLE